MTTAKNPAIPPRKLRRTARDVVAFEAPLWRIRRRTGHHALAWNELREFGPLGDMRWDPHPEPRGVHPGVGVTYASPDLTTTVAEVFQKGRRVRRTGAHELIGWTPTRALNLLDLGATWLVQNGASASLAHGPKRTCRHWARAIHLAWPDLDGLLTPSTWTGAPMVVLFGAASGAFPSLPAFSKVLDDPGADVYIVPAARRLGWRV